MRFSRYLIKGVHSPKSTKQQTWHYNYNKNDPPIQASSRGLTGSCFWLQIYNIKSESPNILEK